MPCTVVRLPGGATAIVKHSKPFRKPCVTCGQPGGLLCDFPVHRRGKVTTCNASMCKEHSVSKGPDLDYCLNHGDGKLKL